MAEFPYLSTPISEPALAAALIGAWPTLTRPQAELLLAMLFLENRKGAAVIQHNYGNLSTHAGPDVNYWRPPWFDAAKIATMPADKQAIYYPIHDKMLEGKEPSAFLAFPSHEAGLAAWVRRMQTKFSPISEAAKTGDANEFARQMAATSYCPGCGNHGPSYAKHRDAIHAAGYYANLGGRPNVTTASSKKGGSDAGGFGLGLLVVAAVILAGVTWQRH